MVARRSSLLLASVPAFTLSSGAMPGVPKGVALHCIGDRGLLARPRVAIVGSRAASELGLLRARRLARELAEAGVVVVSGLAHGIDTAAHRQALVSGGSTVAVIGTPLEQCYPAENRELQRHIAEEHLLVSPFPAGTPFARSNFPKRNMVMAALADATVIIEASDLSGTLHQASACRRMRRPLFLAASLAANPSVTWPRRFVDSGAIVLTRTQQILDTVLTARAA